MSPKYKLNKQDAVKIGHVLAWSVASTLIAGIITVIGQLDLPPQYAMLVPIVNGLLYTAKRFIDGQSTVE